MFEFLFSLLVVLFLFVAFYRDLRWSKIKNMRKDTLIILIVLIIAFFVITVVLTNVN